MVWASYVYPYSYPYPQEYWPGLQISNDDRGESSEAMQLSSMSRL